MVKTYLTKSKAYFVNFRKNHKMRWRYVLALPGLILGFVILFEWEFVQHLLIAMGAEAALHHFGTLAVAKTTAEGAVETVAENVL